MNLSQPSVGEVGMIALSPDPWSAQWMDRHYLLSRLAGYFQVVWMTQPWLAGVLLRNRLARSEPGRGCGPARGSASVRTGGLASQNRAAGVAGATSLRERGCGAQAICFGPAAVPG